MKKISIILGILIIILLVSGQGCEKIENVDIFEKSKTSFQKNVDATLEKKFIMPDSSSIVRNIQKKKQCIEYLDRYRTVCKKYEYWYEMSMQWEKEEFKFDINARSNKDLRTIRYINYEIKKEISMGEIFSFEDYKLQEQSPNIQKFIGDVNKISKKELFLNQFLLPRTIIKIGTPPSLSISPIPEKVEKLGIIIHTNVNGVCRSEWDIDGDFVVDKTEYLGDLNDEGYVGLLLKLADEMNVKYTERERTDFRPGVSRMNFIDFEGRMIEVGTNRNCNEYIIILKNREGDLRGDIKIFHDKGSMEVHLGGFTSFIGSFSIA